MPTKDSLGECTSCLQAPVTNPNHKCRDSGQLLCQECYWGMDQTLDDEGNIRPEVLFYKGDDDE